MKKASNFKKVNTNLYQDLEKTLKKLNKRIHLKLYSLVYNDKDQLEPPIRIKKTVGKAPNTYPLTYDVLPDLDEVYKELKVKPRITGSSLLTELKDSLNNRAYEPFPIAEPDQDTEASEEAEESEKLGVSGEEKPTSAVVSTVSENKLLYANYLRFGDGSNRHTLLYVLEISNADPVSRSLFYEKPQYSFLRMTLDYFFLDFYAADQHGYILLDKENKFSTRYNEDPVQFNRRMARLFFGKMQVHLFQNKDQLSPSVYNNTLSNNYYIHNLLEQIDEISGLPYEGASPFGSMVFVNKQVIEETNFITFSIRFTTEDRIQLDDAKRIRKLLELTNEGKDLFLIADHSHIYGLGEVNWGLQHQNIVLRLDLSGLSKFSLTLVSTEAEPFKSGQVIIQDEQKYYRSDLPLAENILLSVSSKNPRLGEEGYHPERFMKLLENVFWNGQASELVKHKIKTLDLLVRKAREQKHGTMVVITSPTTAKKELATLRKQSTLIEASPINPQHIKFLTAIDGAIYFDTNADCRAIGVILDGNAKEDIGDASRGARFNSAHRYLHKLKDEQKEHCVIAIISEDGMVDLIPEVENEEQLLAVAMEVIDLISEEKSDPESLKEKEEKLKDKGQLLLNSKIADSEWLFKVGSAYADQKQHREALTFLKQAKKRAGNEYIISNYYNLIGICYHIGYDDQESYQEALHMYEKALEVATTDYNHHIYWENISIVSHNLLKFYNQEEFTPQYIDLLEKTIDSSNKAIELKMQRSLPVNYSCHYRKAYSLKELSKYQKQPEQKENDLRTAIEEYAHCIQEAPNKSYLHWNKALCHIELNESIPALDEIIAILAFKPEKKYWTKMLSLLKNYPDTITRVAACYNDIKGLEGFPEELDKLYEEYLTRLELEEAKNAAAANEEQPPKATGE